jgi:hypothetical protein
MSGELADLPRGEYRRRMRQLGHRRAEGKRGRRAAIRSTSKPETFPELDQRGFVVARSQLVLPDQQQG